MPANADLQSRRMNAIPRGLANAFPVFIERAENSELWDKQGKRYIDFAGGIAVLNTGHRHPKVVQAVKEVAEAKKHLLASAQQTGSGGGTPRSSGHEPPAPSDAEMIAAKRQTLDYGGL